MGINKYLSYIVAAILVALAVGCGTASNTNNTNTTNASANNANANLNVNGTANTKANENKKTVNANITREEYEKTKDTIVEEAKRLGRNIGTGANDGWIWTKTRALLATADDLRDSTINVDVENDVVTLSGTVATAAQKAQAAKVAKGVEGVKSVKNNLTVKAKP